MSVVQMPSCNLSRSRVPEEHRRLYSLYDKDLNWRLPCEQVQDLDAATNHSCPGHSPPCHHTVTATAA
jgi:hypothetical protein